MKKKRKKEYLKQIKNKKKQKKERIFEIIKKKIRDHFY